MLYAPKWEQQEKERLAFISYGLGIGETFLPLALPFNFILLTRFTHCNKE
jgi:hypothetical protein